MNNYICINNQKIELTQEQIAKIVAANESAKKQLSEIPEGSTFKIGSYEFVVLQQAIDGTAVILKELYLSDITFGERNNYNGSNADEQCQVFAQNIADIIGWDNIILHDVDLTSNDGLKDYGVVERRASLLTAELYRRYVHILDKYKPDSWWWLATPFSTETHESTDWVLCVSPRGYFNGNHADINGIGVRPFCILKSTIFVSA